MKIFFIYLGLVVVLAGCASPKIKAPDIDQETREQDFDRGSKLLEREDYSGAAEIFKRLLVRNPATETDLMAIYNLAASYEGLNQCGPAADRYREVVRSSANKFSKLEVQALYRLSLMYECMGQDNKTIAALIDTKKRAGELTAELARAELPARLAAAYSRVGNRAKALEYFSQASEGLKQILADSNSSRRQKETLGRTLYQMGKLNSAQREAGGDPLTFLLSLSMQQAYLLQAIELAPPKWARKAEEDLTTAYNNFGAYTVPPAQKHEFGVRALQVINELRKIRLPDSGELEDAVFAQVDKTERYIQNQLNDASATTHLTPEAQRREGLKRKGRLVDVPRRTE